MHSGSGERKRGRGRPRSADGDGTATVQALDRGVRLLKLLAREGRMTLSALSARIAMPPSSVYRLLSTLHAHGFVTFDEAAQEWAVGIEAFRTGSAFLIRSDLIESARAHLRRLVADTGETANLAIADDGFVVFVSQVETPNPIRAFLPPGTRSHMHASAIGKAVLASLPARDAERMLQKCGQPGFTPHTLTAPEALQADLEICRRRGWALDDEERYEGMRCVAAAIYNAFGEAIAGLSVSGPAVRMGDAAVAALGPRVARAAVEITTMIGGRAPVR